MTKYIEKNMFAIPRKEKRKSHKLNKKELLYKTNWELGYH